MTQIKQVHFALIIFTARKRSLGQGNIFTPVCHSVHRGGVRGCSWGACVVAPGGCAWLLPGGHAWLLRGGCVWLLGGACVVALGGPAWLLGGACMVAQGEYVWLLQGGLRGCSGGACVVLFGGACMVLFGGACVVLFRGGMRGFFSFFGYNEIRSMSGRYASYWNAFLFNLIGLEVWRLQVMKVVRRWT